MTLWNHEAQRLRGLEINFEVELDRLRDRKIARLGAAQDFVDIIRGALIKGVCISAIGEEKAVFGVIRVIAESWNPMPQRERGSRRAGGRAQHMPHRNLPPRPSSALRHRIPT